MSNEEITMNGLAWCLFSKSKSKKSTLDLPTAVRSSLERSREKTVVSGMDLTLSFIQCSGEVIVFRLCSIELSIRRGVKTSAFFQGRQHSGEVRRYLGNHTHLCFSSE
jgi:hypothetical protein